MAELLRRVARGSTVSRTRASASISALLAVKSSAAPGPARKVAESEPPGAIRISPRMLRTAVTRFHDRRHLPLRVRVAILPATAAGTARA
jgi:hypothetical protein